MKYCSVDSIEYISLEPYRDWRVGAGRCAGEGEGPSVEWIQALQGCESMLKCVVCVFLEVCRLFHVCLCVFSGSESPVFHPGEGRVRREARGSRVGARDTGRARREGGRHFAPAVS